MFSETIFTLADKQKETDLAKLGETILRKKAGRGTYRRNTDHQLLWMQYQPLESNGWILGLVFPESQLFRIIHALEESLWGYALGGLLLLALTVILISIGVSRPLKKLSKAAAEIGKGNFYTEIPVINSRDELGSLASAFHAMRDSLTEYIQDLQIVTVTKEKIESELKLAQEIQEGILPQTLPPFPKCSCFEVSASLTPAKTVGGDLYDFFMLSPSKVCMVIGDVSGKGVPASLFMAVTQTLHRGMAHEGQVDPENLVRNMNQSLCSNNKAGLFVTYLFTLLDLETGKMEYCNAGHDPFFLLKRDGSLETPCQRHGIPLGVRKNRPYGKSELVLEPGDTIFFYTDGVPESKNSNDEFFGLARLQSVLSDCAARDLMPNEILERVHSSLHAFVGEADQFDDITMLCFRMIQYGTKTTDPAEKFVVRDK